MQTQGFLKAGHTPSLVSAFLYFDISFMIWVMLGALANSIVPGLQLNEAQRGFLVAVPLLGGALLRLVMGPLADAIGPKKTGMLGMIFTVAPLLLGWLWADSFEKMLVVGFLLGIAGASFAVALPMASRWYPPEYQGLALGIAGAGNSGTALATFFGPMLAQEFGWQVVFALALIPLTLVFAIFVILAKDAPNQPRPKSFGEYTAVLKRNDTWLFCLFYSMTFGGFVGFCSFLNSYFKVQYGVDPKTAGYLATACVISGSFLRPIGGWLADRYGGMRMLTLFFLGVGVALGVMAINPSMYVSLVVMFVAMGLLGMGNGSVFQLVPQRFPKEIGVITGIVGAAGGIGGFFLPTLLGVFKQWTGTFAWGFLLFSTFALCCCGLMAYLGRGWVSIRRAEEVVG